MNIRTIIVMMVLFVFNTSWIDAMVPIKFQEITHYIETSLNTIEADTAQGRMHTFFKLENPAKKYTLPLWLITAVKNSQHFQTLAHLVAIAQTGSKPTEDTMLYYKKSWKQDVKQEFTNLIVDLLVKHGTGARLDQKGCNLLIKAVVNDIKKDAKKEVFDLLPGAAGNIATFFGLASVDEFFEKLTRMAQEKSVKLFKTRPKISFKDAIDNGVLALLHESVVELEKRKGPAIQELEQSLAILESSLTQLRLALANMATASAKIPAKKPAKKIVSPEDQAKANDKLRDALSFFPEMDTALSLNPEINTHFERGQTALHIVLLGGRLKNSTVADGELTQEILKKICKQPGINLDARDNEGSTPLVHAVRLAEYYLEELFKGSPMPVTYTKLVSILVEAGANPDIANNAGESPNSIASPEIKKVIAQALKNRAKK